MWSKPGTERGERKDRLPLLARARFMSLSESPKTAMTIRPTALGKKNWLFLGDADAGQRSAILYTIIESCRCRGIDPYAYLRDVLTRLPEPF